MLWLKAFHVIFVVTWFAGLFYLPRLFIYHAQSTDALSIARFKIMQRRLLAITHIGGLLAVFFGLALLWWWIVHAPDYLRQGWLHAKLALVVLLIGFHVSLIVHVRRFAQDRNRRSVGWFRWYNEVPSLLLVAIVIAAVVKPF